MGDTGTLFPLISEVKMQEDTPQQRPVESGGRFRAWHFLIIFLVITALVGIGYLCTHNKAKVWIHQNKCCKYVC